MADNTTPTFTREEFGLMQLADTKSLIAVAAGKLDLNDLARYELASRGLNHDGEWIGFSKARELYERTRNASRINESGTVLQPVMKVIDVTITARMFIGAGRPAMDQGRQHHAKQALMRAVRATLFDAFLFYEPLSSMAFVQLVTVTFSGHVTS